MRQGLLVNGEILPTSEFDNSDWTEKYGMREKDC